MSVQTISLILTGIGILILLYGFFITFKFRNMLGEGELAKAWNKVLFMIGLFIFGYIAYAAQMVSDQMVISLELLSSTLFFAGAIFVAIIVRLNYKVFSLD